MCPAMPQHKRSWFEATMRSNPRDVVICALTCRNLTPPNVDLQENQDLDYLEQSNQHPYQPWKFLRAVQSQPTSAPQTSRSAPGKRLTFREDCTSYTIDKYSGLDTAPGHARARLLFNDSIRGPFRKIQAMTLDAKRYRILLWSKEQHVVLCILKQAASLRCRARAHSR